MLPRMYGPVLSALLLGMVPVWGVVRQEPPAPAAISVAPPASAPLLASVTADADTFARLSASGVLVVDVDSGQRIFSRNIASARPMASLTKLMTALLIVEKYGDHLDTMVTAPATIRTTEGTVAPLVPGEQYSVGDLLSALLVGSANDAAVTLAVEHSGSVPAFVAEMNKRAKELGLKDTAFVNPTGLDAFGQRSTPQDITWLAMFAMRYPQIGTRMSTRSITISATSGKSIALNHTHALLHKGEPDIVAGKTGTTDGAGQCLLSLVEERGRRYLVVLLGSDDRYRDMRTILEALRA